MYGKPLAYIVKINDVTHIEGADKIELAHVLDYTVVVKKHEFSPGDLALYIEVDSVLPDGFTSEQKVTYEAIKDGSYFKGREGEDFNTAAETEAALERLKAASKYPYFEFLREKKFKIKSMKLSKFGVISQGILFRPSDLKITDAKLGKDYTERFEIRELVQDEEEAGLNTQYKKDSWIVRFMMRYAWFRRLRKRKKISETWSDAFPGKSDEENVQKLFTIMKQQYGDKEWVLTEKLEGQNISIYTENIETGIFRKKTSKRVGVCSRTRELNPNGTGKNFWDTVKRLGLDEKVKNIPGEWWCRGEHVGPKIQNNIYKLHQTDVIFFDFYRKEKCLDTSNGNVMRTRWVKLNFEESKAFAKQWDLKFVPILDEHYKLPDTAQQMLEESDKNTVFGNNLKHKREGFVARLRDDYTVSFKVKNPFYSI
jgi:hypothetical protein